MTFAESQSDRTGIDFQHYLQAILTDENYLEWREVYTPTTVESRRRIPAETEIAFQRRFSSRLKLRAETLKPDKAEQGEQDQAQKPQEQVEQWDVLAGLRNYKADHVVLIGKPGSGKTTSLERLLWEEAEQALQDSKTQIPVLVKLRRCTGTIEGLIRDFLIGHQIALEIAQIEELLRQGRFLLLLDGLNELPEAYRTEMANFRDRYVTTPMIISTRDLEGSGTLNIKKTLKMLPLTEPQIVDFMWRYLGEEGDQLFQNIQGDRLRKFAETPLLLWMLCRVYAEECIQAEKEKRTPKLPENLGLAFRGFTQLYDQGTDEHQAIQEDAPVDSRGHWPKLLRHLAFVMMQGERPTDLRLSIPREDAEDCLTTYLQQAGRSNPREDAERWLKDLLTYHLIQPVIQLNLGEHIEFRHQLIQEYYSAEYLLQLLPELSNEELKRDYLNFAVRTDPIALMLNLENRESEAQRVVKLAMDVDLLLAARIAREVKPEFQKEIGDWFIQLKIPQDCKVKLLCKAKLRTLLSELLEEAENFLKHFDRPHITDIVETLGEIGDKRAIPVLSGLLNCSFCNDILFLKTARALAKIGSESAISVLHEVLKGENYYAHEIISIVLGEIGDERMIPRLVKLTNSLKIIHADSISFIAAKTILQFGEKGIKVLVNILKDREKFNTVARSAAARALGEIEFTEQSTLLKKRTRSTVTNTFEESETESQLILPFLTEEIDQSFVSDALLEASVDDADDVRTNVANALGRIRDERVFKMLLKGLGDQYYSHHRSTAAQALGQFGDSRAVLGLLKLLEDRDSDVRSNAAQSLGQISDSRVVPALLQLLEDQIYLVRLKAVQALGKMGNDEAVFGLIKVFEAKHDYQMLMKVAFALEESKHQRAIKRLIIALEENLSEIAFCAAVALGKKGGDRATEILIERLDKLVSESSSLPREARDGLRVSSADMMYHQTRTEQWHLASYTLATIGSERAILALIKVLNCRNRFLLRSTEIQLEDSYPERLYPAYIALKSVDSPPTLIAYLWQHFLTEKCGILIDAIASIQKCCKFYNYDIFQAYLYSRQKSDRHTHPNGDPNAITLQTLESLTIMTDKAPIFNQQHATIGVNYMAEGSKVEFTQYTTSSEQIFKILLTDYQHFIEQLQQKYSTLADPTTVPQIIENEAKLIEAQDQQRWQNFLNLKRLWNGSKKAGIKVGEHFAESNVWAKGAIAFLEGVSEDEK
jgi:HEAT repeat protein